MSLAVRQLNLRLRELLDGTYVYQISREALQELVSDVFNQHSDAGIETQWWLGLLERRHCLLIRTNHYRMDGGAFQESVTEYHHYPLRNELMEMAPDLLATFVNHWAFRGLRDFIDCIRIVLQIDPYPITKDYADYFRLRTSIKIATFIWLNIKATLLDHNQHDPLVVKLRNWQWSAVLNIWDMPPNKMKCPIGRPSFPRWRYEWRVAIYHGEGHGRIQRSARRHAFHELVEMADEYEHRVISHFRNRDVNN